MTSQWIQFLSKESLSYTLWIPQPDSPQSLLLDTYGMSCDQYVDFIWLSFAINKCFISTDYHYRLRTDQDSAFISDGRKIHVNINGVIVLLLNVEAHRYLGPIDRYHKWLRRIYWKTKVAHPSDSYSYSPKIAVKNWMMRWVTMFMFCQN